MGLRDTIRAAGRGMTKTRAAETSKAEEDDEDRIDTSAEADDENEDEATASADAEEDGNEEDETEEDEAEDDGANAKAARMSERRRIRTILKCAEAGSSPDLAMELAFETGMSAAAAVKLLKAAAKPGGAKAPTLGGRMKAEGNPKLGAGGEGDGDTAAADGPEGRLLSLAKARKAQRAA